MQYTPHTLAEVHTEWEGPKIGHDEFVEKDGVMVYKQVTENSMGCVLVVEMKHMATCVAVQFISVVVQAHAAELGCLQRLTAVCCCCWCGHSKGRACCQKLCPVLHISGYQLVSLLYSFVGWIVSPFHRMGPCSELCSVLLLVAGPDVDC